MKPDGTRHVLGEVFNGIGCLVASVVAQLKEQPGMVYLYTEDDFGNCNEDYLYEVIENSESTGAKVFVQNMEGDWEFVEEVLERVDMQDRFISEIRQFQRDNVFEQLSVGSIVKINHKKVDPMAQFRVTKINRKNVKVKQLNGNNVYSVGASLLEVVN